MAKAIKKTKAPAKPDFVVEFQQAPEKIIVPTPVWSTLVQYASLILLAAVVFFLIHYGYTGNLWNWFQSARPMSGWQVIGFAFAAAFTQIEILRFGSVKPLNCMKCMTGWYALGFALVFHAHWWYLYLPAGATVGTLYSGLQMRYL
jgi:hypothetical protein